MQFGVDTEQLDTADLPQEMVASGIVVDDARLASWFDDQKGRRLAAGSAVTLKTEAQRAAAVIQMTALAQSSEARDRKTAPISADQPLVPGAGISVRAEVGRFAAEIGKPIS